MTRLKPGDSLHGFTVMEVNEISEYRGTGIRLIHDLTGADVYHLHNDDKENLFSFAFKTPASDNTGVSHILEHCVLAGSQKYPIKDPFLSMMNGSMNTFLNAMTYPDKTVFPAASTVPKDYFNLMSVYADAVFFPLLREEMFMQEGIRFEPQEDGSAQPSGVVFNEMKGAYSNHDSIAAEYSYRYMFPESPYKWDSGGEPSAIPSLTYEDFKAWHARFYHPSNCRIFLYGDIDTAEQLEFLQENALSRFGGKAEPAEDISIQPSWDKSRDARVSSPLSGDEDEAGATLTLNWKCGSSENSINILAFEVLTEALMGNMGAPLYKAVVESGIGEDLSPVSGLDTDLREMVFSVGVRGSSRERSGDFDKLIMDELRKLADEGIPELSLAGAMHRVEFRNREIKGGAPFGLRLMGRSLKGWLHGGSPEDTISFKEPMEELRNLYETEPGFFEDMIRKWLIENNHRLMLVIEPDATHNDKMEKAVADAVADIRGNLSPAELEAEKQKVDSFRVFQEASDSEEELSKIPSLDLEDVPDKIRLIKTEQDEVAGVPLYKHELFTNGIIYIDFAIDIRDISDDEGMLLPFLSRMICSSGLPGRSYDQVALELALKTGGLYTFLESSRTADASVERKDYLFFRLKTLEKDLDQAFELASDMLLQSEIGDPVRVRDLLFEMRNDFKSSIVPAGHSFCSVKAAAEFDRVLEREDEWRGSRQLMFLNDLTARADESIPSVCISLESMRSRLLNRSRLVFNLTCAGSSMDAVERKLAAFIDRLPSEDAAAAIDPELHIGDLQKTPKYNYGALSVPTSVFFTARTMPASFLGDPGHAHESLLAHMMKTNDLWEEVRMKNGAYGVYASVNGTEGLITVSTYRDPNPGANLKAFEAALDAAAAGRYSENDLRKAIITVVGRDLKPLSPAEESLIGFRRDLYRITDETRQNKREAMLDTTTDDIKAAAARLRKNLKGSVSVVMGPEDVLKELAAEYGEELTENTLTLPM
ncbi:MAG: insulinase family protein [Spirochaetales bacterium]|uniref:Insulinase family protein n=1 Tax=Candidatus Thalassospirochaeta sargassi TaxID=3119039 RepID=A0AAJ1IDF4_9SPIO|nr:insulinase family protein [Spirochaetales bacterium]